MIRPAAKGIALAALALAAWATGEALERPRLELARTRLEEQAREAGWLRLQIAALDHSTAQLRDRIAAQRDSARQREEAEAREEADGAFIAVDRLHNAGARTTRAAFESFVWAVANADAKSLAGLLAISRPWQKRLEALHRSLPEQDQARYGSAAEMFATVYLSQNPVYATAARLISDEPAPDENTTVVTTQFAYSNGHVTTHSDLMMRRTPNGNWRVALSGAEVSHALKEAHLEPPAAAP